MKKSSRDRRSLHLSWDLDQFYEQTQMSLTRQFSLELKLKHRQAPRCYSVPSSINTISMDQPPNPYISISCFPSV